MSRAFYRDSTAKWRQREHLGPQKKRANAERCKNPKQIQNSIKNTACARKAVWGQSWTTESHSTRFCFSSSVGTVKSGKDFKKDGVITAPVFRNRNDQMCCQHVQS